MTTDANTLPILIVDDNLVDQHLTTIHLKNVQTFKLTLDLDFAIDGKAALVKLAQKEFALLILDWNLPEAGQGEVLQQLRKNNHRIPVVVISGREPQQIAPELAEHRAAYLSKDRMTPETFHTAISIALALVGMEEGRFFRTQVSAIEFMARPKILFKCESCWRPVVTDDANAGKQTICPKCNSQVLVPTAAILYTCPHHNCNQAVKIDIALKGEEGLRCLSCNGTIMLPVRRGNLFFYQCKRCGKTIEIPLAQAGKLLFCPKCDELIRGPELKEIADV